MRIFSIEARDDSPEVLIDEAKSLMEICGNSTLRDTNWFYSNLMRWMIAFNRGTSRTTTVNIRLRRINESSLKWIMLIFNKLASDTSNSSIEINWFIDADSPRLLSLGMMLQRETTYRVNLVSHQGTC
jgi:hypothetical protein